MVMPLTRSSGVHATIVHRSAMLRLVRGLEPLDLVHALIDPKGVPSTMANLRKQLPSARYEERKTSNHSFFNITTPFARFVMEPDFPSEKPALMPNPNSTIWRAFCKESTCFFVMENVPGSQYWKSSSKKLTLQPAYFLQSFGSTLPRG